MFSPTMFLCTVSIFEPIISLFLLKAWPRKYGIKNFPKRNENISEKSCCVCVSECGFAKERKKNKRIQNKKKRTQNRERHMKIKE